MILCANILIFDNDIYYESLIWLNTKNPSYLLQLILNNQVNKITSISHIISLNYNEVQKFSIKIATHIIFNSTVNFIQFNNFSSLIL